LNIKNNRKAKTRIKMPNLLILVKKISTIIANKILINLLNNLAQLKIRNFNFNQKKMKNYVSQYKDLNHINSQIVKFQIYNNKK